MRSNFPIPFSLFMMAANIYIPTDYQEIVRRIHALSRENQAKWGTLNLAQMLEHCGLQLKLALGEIELEGYEGNPLMRTALGRWISLYALPWPRGLATATQMDVVKGGLAYVEFEEEKMQLLTLLEQIQVQEVLHAHPFFGALNQKDWGRLIWKHLDHHLKQFGA